MSNAEDYAAKLAEIEAIPTDQIKSPGMPVDVFLQEVENTCKWVIEDQAKLEAAGLDWTLVDDLPIRAGALREAQSLWNTVRFSQEEAQRQWNEQVPTAYDLRDTLLHTFRFAFRNDSSLMTQVDQIAGGAGHADMIQDLNDLALLGNAHADLLTAVGFDVALLATAATTSSAMAALLSQATVDRAAPNAERIIRDKALVYTKQALDEIRKCGQFVFWRDEYRVKGYASQYHRHQGKKGGTNPAPPEE